jgi:hypothetical protein
MTLLSCYYPDFQISSSFAIPKHLQDLLHKVWQRHYEELYEEDGKGTISLEETFEEVLDALHNQEDILGHSRYVLMALILALAVQPTVEAYLPDDTRPRIILILIAIWLSKVIKTSSSDNYAIIIMRTSETPVQLTEEANMPDGKSSEVISRWFEEIGSAKPEASLVSDINNQLFPKRSVGTQAIDEALDVFRNALRVLDSSQAREALLEILDDCFEGYAVFPGSHGRRDLFNWWIMEAVPATWCLQFPQVVYTMKGLQKLNGNLLTGFSH